MRLTILAVRTLRHIEVLPQFLFRDALACLPQNRAQRSRVQFAVARHGRRLPLTMGPQASQLNIAAPLGEHPEAEMLQNPGDIEA